VLCAVLRRRDEEGHAKAVRGRVVRLGGEALFEEAGRSWVGVIFRVLRWLLRTACIGFVADELVGLAEQTWEHGR
jgi:hypothetical protein